MRVSFKTFKQKLIKLSITTSMMMASGFMILSTPMRAYAATTNVTPTAKVSFTFDDGLSSASTQAAPTLAKYGFTGTDYVITGCVGMTTAPNTCHANNDATYMSWAQVQALRRPSTDCGHPLSGLRRLRGSARAVRASRCPCGVR